MNDEEFEGAVRAAFRQSASAIDTAAIASAVLDRVDRAARRRRAVLGLATAMGTAIAATPLLDSDVTRTAFGGAVRALVTLPSAVVSEWPAAAAPWAFAALGAVLVAAAIARATEDF